MLACPMPPDHERSERCSKSSRDRAPRLTSSSRSSSGSPMPCYAPLPTHLAMLCLAKLTRKSTTSSTGSDKGATAQPSPAQPPYPLISTVANQSMLPLSLFTSHSCLFWTASAFLFSPSHDWFCSFAARKRKRKERKTEQSAVR